LINSYRTQVREAVEAELLRARDSLDVAAVLVGEHYSDDDPVVARVGLEVTHAEARVLAALRGWTA
jgi:hypothetical protein